MSLELLNFPVEAIGIDLPINKKMKQECIRLGIKLDKLKDERDKLKAALGAIEDEIDIIEDKIVDNSL
jgi:hypothetical protein